MAYQKSESQEKAEHLAAYSLMMANEEGKMQGIKGVTGHYEHTSTGDGQSAIRLTVIIPYKE